ncbi:ankyrin repeat-containing protein BDA1 [Eucalyptus grandis]|uniref:ankyrin repeat-containing protein BDA1 n=1 Tax=Eucalyptus grandis TaxID=71139 RepID=UPI00192F063D|nr:ankyrin repeat-containing protein BDA1 [Eucalyptus grandis]
MESELYKAAREGNVHSLLELLEKDELLLDRIMTGNHIETPLHIAAMLGHLNFVKEVLTRKAEMASEQDFQSSTPLHRAAARGYLNIVESLVSVNPEVCFVCDRDKRNPLHVAAMKGRVDVLECLVRVRPDAARSVTKHGQTILHLCVKHNKLETLKFLMDILVDVQFSNSRDDDGNTILHLAAIDGQTETIIFLTNKGVDSNISNSKGFTALSLLAQGQTVESASEIKDSVPQTSENRGLSRRTDAKNMVTKESKREEKKKWQNGMHKALMVVAALVATIAFEAGKEPPGTGPPGTGPPNIAFEAGAEPPGTEWEKPLATWLCRWFMTCNTISFMASLSTIMLLISGLPLKRRRITTWIAMLTMWIAITFTALSYSILTALFSLDNGIIKYANDTIVVIVWGGLMLLIFLCHTIRLIWKLVRKVLKFVNKAFRKGKRENTMV